MTIGLAIITYNRPDFLLNCIKSLEQNDWGGAVHRLIVVDEIDDPKYAWRHEYPWLKDVVWSFAPNAGVGVAKNRAMRQLLALGCDHIFLMEDDQLMLDPGTCYKYISYATEHRLHHMNFAHHGPQKNIKFYIDFRGVCCYPDCVGAFCYYTRYCLETVGLMDEYFKNAWEHVELTYRIAQAGLTTPFWIFADHPKSQEMVCEQEGSLVNSVIRPIPGWQKGMEEGMAYWEKKHGKFIFPRPNLQQLAEFPNSGLRIRLKESEIEKLKKKG